MASPFGWLQERLDLIEIKRVLLDRKVPDNLTWWHTLGSAALTAFVVQVATGTILAMYYAPAPDHAYDSIRFVEHSVISGSLLRGIHHWGSSAMVALTTAHMIRVFTMGSYKYPREANWLLGVALFFVVLAFGFTGYLLPWDQKAYWATEVGTNIAGTTPVIGAMLVSLLRGGEQLGAATLTRFYALHVLLLPIALCGILALHLALVVRQGIAPRTKTLEDHAPAKTSDPAYPEYYATQNRKSKSKGVRFWPDIIGKDIIVATLVVLTLVLLGKYAGAGLEPPADPTDTSYVPRPEWYFLPFFQLLKLVPGSLEAEVAIGLPVALVLVLLLLPFFDKRSARSILHRPVAALFLGGILASCGMLLGASIRNDAAEKSAPEVGRILTSSERAGRALFKAQSCGGCHAVGDAKPDKNSDVQDAPDLTEVGLRHSPGWMHSFMENPSLFHADAKMPAYGPPKLTHEEIEELARYMSSLRGKDWATAQPVYADTFPERIKRTEKQ